MFPTEKLRVVLGGPGCGKTTRLLAIVAEEIQRGIHPSQIAFVTFTRAAAEEARDRAAGVFRLDARLDLPWFRTIHSLAYTTLGMSHEEVMGPKDWKAFSLLVREPMKGTYEVTEGLIPTAAESGRNIGDLMLRIVDYAATTCRTLEMTWRELDEPIDWFRLKRFADHLNAYKQATSKVDFTDMLKMYVEHNQPLGVKVAIIDEAQDLTAAQWRMVEHAFARVERVYVGGDDDQAIYRWAGADVEYFLALGGTQEILPHSHRLPRAVFGHAQGIVRRIGHRFEKQYTPDDRAGAVQYHRDADDVDLSAGTWFLLARNGYLLSDLQRMCEARGLPYRTRAGESVAPEHIAGIRLWEGLRAGKLATVGAEEIRLLAKLLARPKPAVRDTGQYGMPDFPDWPWGAIWHKAFVNIAPRTRDYYVACLRAGEKLSKPRVTIETIHGVKGAERDHVLILSDISARTRRAFDEAPDHEHRVFYVGVTRARHSLHIVTPQSAEAYDL